jgi:prepilin-type processing-associated H-X9-DG protein
LLLVDYGKSVADMGGTGNNADDLDRWLATRHLGRANFVRVDGSVGKMTLQELQAQFDMYEASAGESVWEP